MDIVRRRPIIDATQERKIITGLIVSDEFCKKILPNFNSNYLRSSWVRIVVQWIDEYWKKYGNKAPLKDIQDIWKREKDKISPETADAIAEFLGGLSVEYEKGEPFNAEYEIDQAFEYFQRSNLENFRHELAQCIAGNRTGDAETLIRNFQQPTHPILDDIQPITLRELMQMDIEPIDWIIHGLIPTGLTLFAGKPKTGKSSWILNLAIDLSLGRNVFGVIPTDPAKVLYLALEDLKERVHKRSNDILGEDTPTENLNIIPQDIGWPTLDKGGLTKLERWMQANPDTKLIIIDILEKVRKPQKQSGHFYNEDYAAMSTLQKFAGQYNIGLIVIHHTRKTKAKDVFDEISGTFGLAGGADTLAVMSHTDKNVDRVFQIRGRDIEEKELAFNIEGEYRWKLAGEAAQFQVSDQRQMIVDFLKFIGTPVKRQLILRVMENKIGKGIDVLLNKLVKNGSIKKIDKQGRGIYAHGGFKDFSETVKNSRMEVNKLKNQRLITRNLGGSNKLI